MIAGTSAGAAVMSEVMLTGDAERWSRNQQDTSYKSTVDFIGSDNLEYGKGMGFLDSIIIDQHFIKRSRYNRLFSALLDYPEYTAIGIDESTALLVYGDNARVIGDF